MWQNLNFGPVGVWKSRFSSKTCNYILFTFNSLNMKETSFEESYFVFCPRWCGGVLTKTIIILTFTKQSSYPKCQNHACLFPLLTFLKGILLEIEKRRKMHLWARMETPSHVGGSLKWKYLPPVRWVLSHPSRKHTSGTEDTKYRGKSVNGSHFFFCFVFQ